MAQDDKVIECVDCHGQFVFTANEQAFYQKKGFTDPKRCTDCRQKKKDRREYDR